MTTLAERRFEHWDRVSRTRRLDETESRELERALKTMRVEQRRAQAPPPPPKKRKR